MKISAAAVIHDGEQVLVCHVTRRPYWTLPKGVIDGDETPWQACVRETREETGVDLLALRASVRDLGEHPYYSGKRLHFFSVETQELPDTQGMFCVSQVHADAEEPYPEVDDFRYCPLVEAVDKLNKSQAEAYANVVLPALGLADDSESAS